MLSTPREATGRQITISPYSGNQRFRYRIPCLASISLFIHCSRIDEKIGDLSRDFRFVIFISNRNSYDLMMYSKRTAVAKRLRCCTTNRTVAGSIPDDVTGIFYFFRSHYGPGADSASNRNEYQEYFVGGKGGRCIRLTLPPSWAVVT